MRAFIAVLLATSTVALLASVAPEAVARPDTPTSHSDVHGVQRGAVVRQHTAGQVNSFVAAHSGLLTHPIAGHAFAAADTIHPSAGTAFVDEGDNQGAQAVQSVTTSLHPNNGGTTIYTPTMYPAGGSCIEVTTVYTTGTQAVQAWDWCNHIDFEASVPIDSSFLSRYTNGSSAYTVQIVQTDAASNTWTAYLYDYSTNSYDTFYTSSGSTQAGTTGWDVNELYSDVQSDGTSYACTDMAGLTFSASGIQVDLGGNWQAASPSNSDTRFDSGDAAYDCPSRSYQMINQYDHWQVVG